MAEGQLVEAGPRRRWTRTQTAEETVTAFRYYDLGDRLRIEREEFKVAERIGKNLGQKNFHH